MIYILFVIFIVIASLLMIGIVLIQESKGGGLPEARATLPRYHRTFPRPVGAIL